MITIRASNGSATLGLAARLREMATATDEPDAVAPVVQELLNDDFDARRSPAGDPWAQRKRPTGSWPLLEKTREMRVSQQVIPVPGGVSMSYDGPAQYHQRGTPKMVARKLLPENSLAPGWSARIGQARIAWLRAKLGVS